MGGYPVWNCQKLTTEARRDWIPRMWRLWTGRQDKWFSSCEFVEIFDEFRVHLHYLHDAAQVLDGEFG